MSHYNIIEAKDLLAVDPKKAVILDVRTDAEHGEKSLKMSHQHVEIDKANPENFVQNCKIDKDAEIYVLCRGGGRAKIAAYQLATQGYNNVFVVEGGIIACENCGLEIIGSEVSKPAYCESIKKPNMVKKFSCKPISVEGQVRIVVGFFVVFGVVLSLICDPSFILVSLFVGVALIFAGVTDVCFMSLFLKNAPWNRNK